MSHRKYTPGPATAQMHKQEGEQWKLVLTRELRHPPEKVWRALTEPEQLREWAPFDADGNLGTAGASVTLTTVGAPKDYASATTITRAEPPKLLEYNWGGGDMRWELEGVGSGTRLTLWAQIDKRFIAMGAAGWHVCLDVLEHLLGGEPLGRLVAQDALQSEGWQQLHAEYSKNFGVEAPKW
jgi:uncharacterized protein YndB with AHSA1/START domain